MHTPTEEQAEIISKAKTTSDSILINALAGAAKTTTLEMICGALPVQPILSLAFNKKIATEMEKRLPGHVKCQTLNSLGHRVWQSTCSSKLQVDKDKTYNIFKSILEPMKKSATSDAWEVYSLVRKAVAQAKLSGYIPDDLYPHAKRLISAEDFWSDTDEDEDELVISLTEQILAESIKLSYKGLIDFDDQIYMPTLFGGSFPRFPLVMVDEAQDLSAINHEMLLKLVTARLMAVGDPYQSIYGFRGAVQEGMSQLQKRFSMTEMGLSVSFRCPVEIVKMARKRAPHMQWAEGAIEGEVHYVDQWTGKDIPDGSSIICRNNAPLFSCALRLLRSGRGIQMVGFDIGPGLVKVLKSFGSEAMSSEQVHQAINQWETERLQKVKRSKAATADRADCLRVFASAGPTLGAAIAYAESLFKSRGPIFLLSGHKAKGLEWENVFHLDPWRIPSEYAFTDAALEQEKNIEYVITTRSKNRLTHIDMEGFDAKQ